MNVVNVSADTASVPVGAFNAAKILGVSEHEILRLVDEGALVPASRRPLKFAFADLIAYRKKTEKA